MLPINNDTIQFEIEKNSRNVCKPWISVFKNLKNRLCLILVMYLRYSRKTSLKKCRDTLLVYSTHESKQKALWTQVRKSTVSKIQPILGNKLHSKITNKNSAKNVHNCLNYGQLYIWNNWFEELLFFMSTMRPRQLLKISFMSNEVQKCGYTYKISFRLFKNQNLSVSRKNFLYLHFNLTRIVAYPAIVCLPTGVTCVSLQIVPN